MWWEMGTQESLKSCRQGGGKSKGKGFKSKGWDSEKGQSKGKGMAGKGSEGDIKGEGKGVFDGNCHNCKV